MSSTALQMIGGARRAKDIIRTVLYVMLTIPPSYKKDLNYLVHEFKYRHYQVEEKFDYNKPDVRHMTLLKVDLILTPYMINRIIKGTKLSKRPKNNNDFFQQLKRDRGGDLWEKFSEYLEIQLENQISKDLANVFRGLPADTTASCYHSRFNLFGDFAVIQYKPDLGFYKTIFPAVKKSVNQFFKNQVKAGTYYDHPRNVLLHISFARLKDRNAKRSSLNKIKSNQRENWLGPELAKNFVVSRDHFLDNDAIMVSTGRPQFY